VVVVVVVVRCGGCGTARSFMSGCRVVCPHATDATTIKAMLKSIFFMISPFLVQLRRC
jgi:hypothetical protein